MGIYEVLDKIIKKDHKEIELVKEDYNEKECENVNHYIRLYYIALNKFNRYGTNERKVGATYGISSPFKIPTGMTEEEAYKVISFLSEKVERENKLEPGSQKSVAMVSYILGNYGFERLDGFPKGYLHTTFDYSTNRKIKASSAGKMCKPIEGVKDLFTVDGDLDLFENCDLNNNYFEWFSEGVPERVVKTIYGRIGIDFGDLASDEIQEL